MVKEANLRQAAATRALKESSMKVDVLSAEVTALKTLVLTSTPSHPNLSREDSISMPGNYYAYNICDFHIYIYLNISSLQKIHVNKCIANLVQ